MLAELAERISREPRHGSRQSPLKDRFLSWWNGVEYMEPPARERAPAPATDEVSVEEELPWSIARLEAIETVWGPGFMLPGGEKYARKMMAVLGLSSKQSVLEFAPGLGGTARTLSHQHNLWMDAFEPIGELAHEGHRRSLAEGLGKRVPIKTIDPETYEFQARRYDAIYSRERLFTMADKERFIDQCVTGLKRQGQILLTDFVLRNRDSDALSDPAIHRPGEDIYMWTAEQYRSALEQRGFSVFLSQDITTQYLDHIHTSWSKAPDIVRKRKLSARISDLVVQEGEVWLARWRAFACGDLGVIRIHAQITESID